jgi:AcrR family transcriptional regulator
MEYYIDMQDKNIKLIALSSDKWAEAALEAIATSGVAQLAIESLARALGVTKGSFYWHFPNRSALIKAAVTLWAQRETEDVLARLDSEPDPRRRIEQIVEEAVGNKRKAAIYLALAAAADDPNIGPVFQRIVERRIAYLAACFEQLEVSTPRHRALVAFSQYVGIMHTIRDAPESVPKKPQFEDFVKVAIATVIPG